MKSRSQSGKVISEPPNVLHSSTGECIFKKRFHALNDKNKKKTFKKKQGVGLEVLATHHAPAPGDPSLRNFRNNFRCQNVDIDIPRFENPPSLQIFKLCFRCLEPQVKKNESKAYGILQLHSPRYIQPGSSTSRLRADWSLLD